MAGFFKRAVAVSVGILLGMVIVAGAGSLWRRAPSPAPRPTEPPAIQREPAPDTRA
jgi:hypothetical protein